MTSTRLRVVTPDTDPDRFLPEETALFRAGKCSWQLGWTGFSFEYCGQPSAPGASFGHCSEHEAELLEDYWPDGTLR